MDNKRWITRTGAIMIVVGFLLPSASSLAGPDRGGQATLISIPTGALIILILAFLPERYQKNVTLMVGTQAAGAGVGLFSIASTLFSLGGRAMQFSGDPLTSLGTLLLFGGYGMVGYGLYQQWHDSKEFQALFKGEVKAGMGPVEAKLTFEASGSPGAPAADVPGASPAQPGGRYGLRVLNGRSAGKLIALDSHEFTLGRDASSSLVLSDRTVSRQHARLCQAQGSWFIQDQHSMAGVYVNHQRVPARRLEPGDQIEIGAYLFEFVRR